MERSEGIEKATGGSMNFGNFSGRCRSFFFTLTDRLGFFLGSQFNDKSNEGKELKEISGGHDKNLLALTAVK